MAKTDFLSWSTTAGSNTDIDGIGIQGSNAVNNFDNAFRTIMAQLRRDVDGKVVYANKSANYTALANDNNAVHRFTAAATVALTAAATLGNNWHYTVFADGGAVIIDPDASELINGATTYTVQDGNIATIICDGSAFRIFVSGLTGESINGGPLGGFRNKIINGDFEVAKRATSTPAGAGFLYLTDRWARVGAGSTLAYARNEFAPGVTSIIPGNVRYFGRFTVVSSAGAPNFAAVYQAMEDVRTLSGKTVTLTFYAKADASRNIGIELYQFFGTGGSPSSAVTGIGAQQCALTTAWQRFDILINVPSISGKTRGTESDTIELVFWFDAGSNWSSRASSIGQQSGTFDISHVSIVEGDARQELDPFSARSITQEEQLCARYFQRNLSMIVSGYNSTTGAIYGEVQLSPNMRTNHSSPVFSATSTSSSNAGSLAVSSGTAERVRVSAGITATGAGYVVYDMTADFEI